MHHHAARVAAETLDVVAHPLQGRDAVQGADVGAVGELRVEGAQVAVA